MPHDEYVLETFQHNGYTVKIISDPDPTNPRKDYDHVGRMVCWHRRYDLGDETRRDSPEAFLELLVEDFDPTFTTRWDDKIWLKMVGHGLSGEEYKRKQAEFNKARTEALWKIIERHYVILPLALLDHSGLHIWVGRGPHWSDPGGWDSGQVGWIYCTKKKAREEWGKRKDYLEKARKCLEAEVAEYDQYLTGDVWGYVIETPDGEQVDSCWGFFGSEYCKEEAKNAVPNKPAPDRTPEQLRERL